MLGLSEILDESMSMMDELTLKMHIIRGDTEKVKSEISTPLPCGGKFDETTILHIAAEAGQDAIISTILEDGRYKGLLYCKNKKGDLPIHVALKGGQKDAVRQLLNDAYPGTSSESNRRQLEIENEDKNTALHIALDNQFLVLSEELFKKCPQTSYCLNKSGICPLYMAIKARYFKLAELILEPREQNDEHVQGALMSTKSVVHEAILARNKELLEKLVEKYDVLKYALDRDNRTILSYAAEIGFLDGVEYLLTKHPELACQPDKDGSGSYPIHKACCGGNVEVIKLFLFHFPFMKCLLNQKNQSILHIAAENGQNDVLKYLLGKRNNNVEQLINLKDDDGNTPLHLATMGKHPKVVYTLTADKSVQVQLQNKQHLTALDSAEIHHDATSFEERLTWMALLYANVPRTIPKTTTRSRTNTKTIEYKDRINTLLVVCTLIATVTFAATFTMPGGYRSSHQQEGMATLAHRRAFQAFVFCNNVAMYSSTFSAVTLIWAHLDDINLSLLSFDFALPSLGIALTMMPVAFMTGSYVVLHTVCNWLAIAVLILGGCFLVAVLAFIVPLYFPTSHIKHRPLRYIFQIIFRWMLLGCSRS